MELLITCNTGVESFIKKELTELDLNISKVADRLVFFEGDESAIADVNLWSRVGNKVYVVLGKSKVNTFDDLFEFVYSFNWKDYVKIGQSVTVLANTISSKLSNVPTVQAIGKKSIVKKLLNGQEGRLSEDESLGKIEITLTIDNDECYILLNTTGTGLHHRGYKKFPYEAPLKENLAATCVHLSDWKYGQTFTDLFCGSGSIVIEAALIGKNIAPGTFRNFDFQHFQWFDKNIFENAKYIAEQKLSTKKFKVLASDISPIAIDIAKKHARFAGVEDCIEFQTNDFLKLDPQDFQNHCIVSNPPYGLRLQQDNLELIYETLGDFYEKGKKINGGIFTGFETFGKMLNLKRWKSRKLYNGGEKCYFYKFNG